MTDKPRIIPATARLDSRHVRKLTKIANARRVAAWQRKAKETRKEPRG
jgi:hypothetical protein